MVQNLILKSIKSLLESASVCERCLLRFLAVKEYTDYLKENIEKSLRKCLDGEVFVQKEKEQALASDVTYDPPEKKILLTPCPACLGILQDVDNMVLKIETAVAENQYQFSEFVLHVSLPVVIDLRDKLLFLYLQAELGESFSTTEKEIPSVKDICKWVIGSQFGAMTKTDFTPYSDFQIVLTSSYPETVKECLVLLKKCPKAFPNARRSKSKDEDIFTKTAVLNAIDALQSSIKEMYTLPPTSPVKSCVFDKIQCTHSPLYLGGRYNKYSRELSQTPWIVDGERRMESSVSELITDVVLKHITADKIVFSSSGREDVDVKMLGSGRPFVLEILNPRKLKWSQEEIKKIEMDINQNTDLIAVHKLQVITKEDTLLLKEGEEEKRKTYSALCIVGKPITQEDIIHLEKLKDLKLEQKTPIRVLHRRTLSTREKILHSMKGKLMAEKHKLLLSIEAQAGTYIKEFIHSDFGRTTPSLGTLLNTTADILELDVEEIHLDWPPVPMS